MVEDICCEEKLRLLFEFRKATISYSARVAEMAEIAGTIPKAEFALLRKAATQAHQICVATRDCFYKHTQEHGC